ncbi:DUF4884 domain-containing protein [Segetibacter aerophilus]|uniref:DUF4884 domain-containing protein n=1 Tax=Segetibacter aerophilus TaxID=670293 RepID=UPI0011BF10F8|nr:DUF4884 domain-containing protein [Segetibacter aerophilus]
MKKCLTFLLSVRLVSCTVHQPIATDPAYNNQTYKIDYLFEHDGCKVYRFYDRGHYVYFTNCRGEAINTEDSLETRNSTQIIRNKK